MAANIPRAEPGYSRPASSSNRIAVAIFAILILGGLGLWAYMATRPTQEMVVQRDVVGLLPLDGKIVVPPSARADIYSPTRAPVDKVSVSVGAHVNKGDALVELSFPSADAAVEQARQTLKAAETASANAAQSYDAQIAGAQRQLDAARAAEKSALQTPPAGSNPPASSDTTTPPPTTGTDAQSASDARMTAEQSLQLARADKEASLAPYRAQVEAAREAYRQANAGEKISKIRAPITGTVLALNAQPGQEVGTDPKVPVATIVDLSAIQAHAVLDPQKAGYVKPGMPVQLTFKELPGKTFEGKVSRLTSEVNTRVGGLVKEQNYVAIIEFKNVDALARPDMTPNVAVKMGEVKNALAVPNDAVDHDSSGRPIVKALRSGQWQPVIVETGLTDGKYTQIKAGLKKGETIQVTPDLIKTASLPGVKR